MLEYLLLGREERSDNALRIFKGGMAPISWDDDVNKDRDDTSVHYVAISNVTNKSSFFATRFARRSHLRGMAPI